MAPGSDIRSNSRIRLNDDSVLYELVFEIFELVFDCVQAGDALIQFYNNFITDFETKINLLKLAHFAVVVSRQYPEKEAAVNYLEGPLRSLGSLNQIIYIETQKALFKLEQGDQKECKKILDDGKSSLDSMTDIDPSVYANFYWVSSQYHKFRQEFLISTKVLCFILHTRLWRHSRTPLSWIWLSIYHSQLYLEKTSTTLENCWPIPFLLGTNVEWLYHILQAFNHGDLVQYQELCRVHQAALIAQPALVENEKETINILCLIEIIFSRPAEDRTIPLSVIAERTKLSIEDVEHLLMKSLSVHLIEGIIDQVNGTVYVSWAQPRVLGIPQIKSLRDQLDNWVDKVHTTFAFR
ncbi:unnamed protein product [Thlaspi arvense]|uniref:PCI domain-containing protein n=1 Tax=Thlaspi arvense TaxID=13288 RepID=A0AAU9RSR6_THLAR|nr:unnamed protein product [Thlaspi arvense]